MNKNGTSTHIVTAMSWPFSVFDMKPGSLHEVRASCTFAKQTEVTTDLVEVKFVQVKKGTILMSLGYEAVQDKWASHHFKFLYGEEIIFLPIRIDPEKYNTEEELIEAIQITLFSFVKPTSHGWAPKAPTSQREPFLIGDSRGDDDGYDDFH